MEKVAILMIIFIKLLFGISVNVSKFANKNNMKRLLFIALLAAGCSEDVKSPETWVLENPGNYRLQVLEFTLNGNSIANVKASVVGERLIEPPSTAHIIESNPIDIQIRTFGGGDVFVLDFKDGVAGRLAVDLGPASDYANVKFTRKAP